MRTRTTITKQIIKNTYALYLKRIGRRQNRRADRPTRRVMCRGNKRLVTPSMRIV